MKNISYKNVMLKGGFLHEKQLLNENVTMDAVYDRFYDTGRIESFKCDWIKGQDKKPHYFWDSDVAKWMEGAAYILNKKKVPELEAKVESLIDQIEKNQGDDGYFNVYFTVCEPKKRFTYRGYHELYCAGHLFEAAVAYFEATGKDRFLKLMEKYADCIERAFVSEKTAKFVTPGHEEIELALVRMYRATGKKKYLNLAKFFIDNRGIDKNESTEMSSPKENQSHLPVRLQNSAEGHCVRACYLYSAMADLAYETDDKELYAACRKIFTDIVRRKMYITGGIGSTRIGEAFTIGYDLKNDKAYAETCAAISLMFFAQRMMQFENDSVYADIVERVLYNGMMSGLSLDGRSFFYENPLEIDLRNYIRFLSDDNREKYAIKKRVEVFDCSCCPPNLNRVLASVGGYIYGYDKDTIYINQFADSVAEENGMKIIQETDFPKSGTVKIKCENVKKLFVRIPSWCEHYQINVPYRIEKGYALIEAPEEVTVKFNIQAVLMQSNSEVYENSGKAAVCIGPFVCAAESIDNIENLHSIFIDKNLDAHIEYSDKLCGYVLKVKAYKKITDDSLYSKFSENFEDFILTMIPFASFANRKESNMCVWFNVK